MHAFSYTQVTALKIGNKYPIHHPANVAEKREILLLKGLPGRLIWSTIDKMNENADI